MFLLFLIAYISWLGYLLVRALFTDTKSLPYLGKRIYFFGLFTIFIIVMVFAGMLFGMIGPIHNNAAELLSYLALLNLYVYVLAVVYLPTKQVNEDEDPRKMIGMVRLEGSGVGGAAYLEAMEASASSGREDDSDDGDEDFEKEERERQGRIKNNQQKENGSKDTSDEEGRGVGWNSIGTNIIVDREEGFDAPRGEDKEGV